MNESTSSAKSWYVRRADRVLGPYPTAMVRRFVLHGRIVASDELSSDQKSWAQARTLPPLLPRELRMLNPKVAASLLKGTGVRRERAPVLEAAKPESEVAAEKTPSSFMHYLPRLLGLVLVIGVLGALVSYLSNGEGSDKPDCDLAAASGVNWSNCQMGGAKLGGSDLSNARLRNTNLSLAELDQVNANGADLAYANLERASLQSTQLGGAILTGANLRGADLRGAALHKADLSYADLTGALLDGVNLTGARLGKTIWTDGRECMADAIGQC